MITITININGKPVYTRSAINVKTNTDGTCSYKIDEGTIIKHLPNDGAIELSKKMLDTIEEVK